MDESAPAPSRSVPLSAVFSGDPRGAASGGRLLQGEEALEPFRGIVEAGAEGAVLVPVQPPAPAGGYDLYLLLWFNPGEVSFPRAGPMVREIAVGLSRELSRRRASGEEESIALSARIRDAAEQCSHGEVLMDPDGRVVWANPAAARAAGPDRPIEAGAVIYPLLPGETSERLHRLVEVAGSGGVASEELEFGSEDGEGRLYHATVDPVAGEEPLFLLSLRSLSEQDRMVDLLRREKEFTRSLLEAAKSCVLGMDVEGRTILFNRVVQKLSGFDLGDLLGREAVEILVPESSRPVWRDAHLRALRGESVDDTDFILRTRSGEERILCLNAGRINDGSGLCRGVLWTGRDVTQERGRENRLRVDEESTRRSLKQLKEFSRISSMILQEKDLESVCKMFVDAISEVSTFRRAILTLCDEDFRGYQWHFAGLGDEEVETFHRNKMSQRERVTIFQERFRLGNSYYIPHTEGWHYEGVRSQAEKTGMVDWHPDDFLFIPLYGSNRRVVGVVSVDDPQDGRRPSAESLSPLELFANQVAHSIEEKKLDQEVKQTTERYRVLVETMYESVFSVDLRERILLANAALSQLVGVSAELINGRPLGSIMEPEDLTRFRSETALHEGGRVAQFESRLRADSGELIPVHVSISPYMEDGVLEGCFAVVRDLREQRRVEVERRTMQEQLVQAEKLSALGELISGIAHELNNPLTGVMGYSQLLMSSEDLASGGETAEKIHREAVRCQKIVQNLLAFARRRAPERKRIDVNALVDATLELRSYQLKVDGIEVATDLARDLPTTLGDFHQLQQVFINIINNAHHAIQESGRPGRLEIRTQLEGGVIRTVIRDNGRGIPEESIQRIFDPFFTTKETGKGTGLGLSLSYGIVKEHDGEITVVNIPGGGACFTVELPVRDAGEQPEETQFVETDQRPLCSKNILVVDDEETILDLLESVLEAAGHSVETACNGRQALEKVRKTDYDIIISDLKMPDMGGQKLYECVAEIKPHLKHRMIFSTGDTVNPVTQELFKRTGNLHLAKPFRLEEVEEIIRQALEREEAGDTPSAS